MNHPQSKIFRRIFFILLFMASTASAQDWDFDKVKIETIKAAGCAHMLKGAGGNIGVCAGDDGVFLIDDQFAPLTEKIRAAIAKISDKNIRFLINTHWHFDHVGGNESIGESGAVIVAHENVRNRMSSDQFIGFFQKNVPAAPESALPIITFSRDLTFHLNGEEIHVFHVKNAHTDGDAIVYFKNANVIHTGDIYFEGIYPFIDTSSRGTVDGVIKAVERILDIIDDDTKVIPGHGPMSNKAGLADYLYMLVNLKEAVVKQIQKGKTIEEIQSSQAAREFDEKLGHGFLTSDQFLAILYEDLEKKAKDKIKPSFTNFMGMKFVYIKPGSFMMGSPLDEPERHDMEEKHRVTLTKGYYLQTTEVTQSQWRALMGENPSRFKDCGDDCPVENVSWEDAHEFLKRLNKRESEGGKYRLPTEAEWERAARAGTGTPFYFGECLSTDQANYDGSRPLKDCDQGERRETTVPVASFEPNALGLYDMHGNVWEWCGDWHSVYPEWSVANPVGPETGFRRVLRGGGWTHGARDARSANRRRYEPDYRWRDAGFRLAWSHK